MATGGYKCVQFSWQGGRSDSALDRCKYILHGFCSEIVNANLGWDWDTDLNDGTIDSCHTMGGHTDSIPNIAYVLTKTFNTHTYKLCIGLNYHAITALREQDCVPYYIDNETTVRYQFTGTLYTGMIKDGSFTEDQTYGIIPGNSGQFLRWMTFNQNCSTNSVCIGQSFAVENSSNELYSYYAVIKDAQIAIFCSRQGWNNSQTQHSGLKGYLAGELFSSTAHLSDTNTFACLYLCSTATGNTYISTSYGSNYTDRYTEISHPIAGDSTDAGSKSYGCLINAPSTEGFRFIYYVNSDNYSYSSTNSQIFTAAGDPLYGMYSYSKRWIALRFDTSQVDSYVSNTTASPGGRWTPCYVLYRCTDQDTYGIVQGDSFKGFVDTDLLRGVNCTYQYGQQLDGGNFIYLGGGFALGWDSSNTVSLFS